MFLQASAAMCSKLRSTIQANWAALHGSSAPCELDLDGLDCEDEDMATGAGAASQCVSAHGRHNLVVSADAVMQQLAEQVSCVYFH